MKVALLFFGTAVLAVNARLSYLVAREVIFTACQKGVYILMVWMLPALGAYLAWSVLNEEKLQFRHANSEEDFMDVSDANNLMTHHDSNQP